MNGECDHIASANPLPDTTTQEQNVSIVNSESGITSANLTNKEQDMPISDSESGITGANLTKREQDLLISDSESPATGLPKKESPAGSFPSKFGLLVDDLIRLEEEDVSHMHFKQVFLAGMGDQRDQTIVEAMYRNSNSSLLGKAQTQVFQIFFDAMVKKREDNVNMRYAWYSSSEDGICGVLKYGFGQCENPDNGGLYGCGLYLTPVGSSIESAMSSVADENGLRHLLLCRVILGNQEEVLPGSKQFHPSSEEFDSGVDNRLDPKKYIVWSTNMNTHILPEYIISFRNPSIPIVVRGCQRIVERVRRPTSPWVPLPRLISIISTYLPPSSVNLIKRYHTDFVEKRITRIYLIRRLRQIAGDGFLLATIKFYNQRKVKEETMEETVE